MKKQTVSQSSRARSQLSFPKTQNLVKPLDNSAKFSSPRNFISTRKARLDIILAMSLVAAFPMIECAAKTVSKATFDYAGQSLIAAVILLFIAGFATYLSKKEDDSLFFQANIGAIGYYLILIAGKIFPNFTQSSYNGMLLIANLVGPATAVLVIFMLMAKVLTKK
jgi:hypothetical protein